MVIFFKVLMCAKPEQEVGQRMLVVQLVVGVCVEDDADLLGLCSHEGLKLRTVLMEKRVLNDVKKRVNLAVYLIKVEKNSFFPLLA